MQRLEGRGTVLTGQLGEVMKESGQAALSYTRSRAKALGLPDGFYDKLDVHVHVPGGGIAKDGPSAGITIATAIISALTSRPAHREVAMTGEITLRGRVLPVGGIREKVLAAHRAGLKTFILPRQNAKDLADVPAHVKRELRFVEVEQMDEVLPIALHEPRKASAPSNASAASTAHTRCHPLQRVEGQPLAERRLQSASSPSNNRPPTKVGARCPGDAPRAKARGTAKHVSRSSTRFQAACLTASEKNAGVAGSGCGALKVVVAKKRSASATSRSMLPCRQLAATAFLIRPQTRSMGLCSCALYFGSHRKRKRACSGRASQARKTLASWVMTLSSATMTSPVG